MFDHVWPILKDAEKWAYVLPKQRQQSKAFEGSHGDIPTQKFHDASYSVDLNANDDQVHVDMQTNSLSNCSKGIKKEKTRKRLGVKKTHLLAKLCKTR